MSNECRISIKLPKYGDVARTLKRDLPGLIAATLQTQRGMIFDKSGNYNGHSAWAPLKCRDGQPLKDRNTLSQSIGPHNDGRHPVQKTGSIVKLGNGIVTIGTNIEYAWVHNQGLVIYPRGKKPMRFMSHGKAVFARKVTIPKRNFGDFTSEDVTELQETCAEFITATIGGA